MDGDTLMACSSWECVAWNVAAVAVAVLGIMGIRAIVSAYPASHGQPQEQLGATGSESSL